MSWISVESGVKDGLGGSMGVCVTKEASEGRCGVAEEGGSGGWI